MMTSGSGGRIRGPALRLALVLAVAPALPAMAGTTAAESPWQGPLRVRNQFPLSLHHLSFPGEDARVAAGGRLALSLDLTAANVFSASDDVARIHEGAERRSLARSELDALVAADPRRDLFLFDGGVTRLAVFLRYAASERFELGLELPIISLAGGELDGVIEGFHDAFGLSQSGRLGYPRDRLQVALYLGGETLFVEDDDATSGFGDLVISGKLLLADESEQRPQTAVRLAVKPSTGDGLLSSGHTEWGVNLVAAKHFSTRAVYLNAGYVVSGGWWAMPAIRTADVWSLLVAYEQRLRRASFVIQSLTQSSFLAGATTSRLADPSHEVTVGLRFRARRGCASAVSLTENYATFQSSPDLGVHVGAECALPAGSARSLPRELSTAAGLRLSEGRR